MSRMQEKALCRRILKDIHGGGAVVIINDRKQGTLGFEISNQDSRFPFVAKLEEITLEEMNYWLSRFALEVKKSDGTNYRHEVLHE